MNAQTEIKTEKREVVSSRPTGLDLLRAPFPEYQISKLPKPTKKQTDEVRQDFKKGIRCSVCGQWHHPKVVHLDYVGHAALTDRLLDCDPNWNWEPLSFSDNGTPLMDENGGMWIKLTVCGQTRIGYGHPDGKRGGDAIKEVIGDALRNAAMRFGAALDLWHKGELHKGEDVAQEDRSGSPSETDDDGQAASPRQDQRQQGNSAPRDDKPSPEEITADRMITAIRKVGAPRVEGDEQFKADLARIKSANPECAARVEHALQCWHDENPPAIDIDPNDIPY